VVWIDVLPSMKGFAPAVRAGLALPLSSTGAAAGKSFNTGLLGSVGKSGMAQAVKAQADAAAAAVDQAAAKAGAARKREADAAGAVRVAELKLAEVRDKEGAQASAVAAAEERLARAQRTSASAAKASAAAAADLGRAQAIAAKTSSESAVATGRFQRAGLAATGAVGGMAGKMGGFVKSAGSLAGIFAVFGAAHFAGESIKSAMDFQRGTQVLQTAAGELPKNLAMVRSGLMAISSETGTSLDQMIEGMYTVEKAGIRGGKGLAVMRAAAKGAKDEGADLGIVTNALTTIMTTSNGKITNASKAMNALMVAAGHSKTTMQEYAGSLSSVLPLASKVGITFDQVSGAISAMTAQGMSAQQTTQDLNHVIASLSTPTRAMSYEMHSFGINSADVRDKLGKRGLQGTIEFLSDSIKNKLGASAKVAIENLRHLPAAARDIATKYQQGLLTTQQFETQAGKLKGSQSVRDQLLAAGPAMRGYTEALSKMTGGQLGLTTALMLTGRNGKTFAETTKDVGKAMNSTADFNKKWGITSKSTANALAIAHQTIRNLGTALATTLLPGLAKAAMWFANATMAVAKFTKQNWSWLGPVVKGLGLAVLALGGLSAGIAIFEALTSPISLVVLGITALAVGLIYAYKHSETFRRIVNDTWRIVKDGFKVMWDLLQPNLKLWGVELQVLGTIAKWLWDHAFKPTITSIIGAVAFLMTVWSKMLGALGHIPGFGWAKDASKALGDAASAANDLVAALNGVPKTVDTTVTLHYSKKQAATLPGINKPRVLPGIGQNARGTAYWRGGLSLVGENGPELISLPTGARIDSAMQTRQRLRKAAAVDGQMVQGGNHFTIEQVVAQDVNDMLGQLQQRAHLASRDGITRTSA
jgi:hypothetical protein